MKTGVTALAIALTLNFAVAPDILLSQALCRVQELPIACTNPAGQKYNRKAARMPKCEIDSAG
jgi:hypothetical protein